MADELLLSKIHDLSDLELAALLCLVAQEHCIIDTHPEVLDETVQELELIATKVFGLPYAVIDCSENTSLDDFANAILTVENSESRNSSPVRTRQDYFLNTGPIFKSIRSPPSDSGALDNKSIASVIIAKNLDEAPRQVQIQALELIRARRIYTRTAVQIAPKRFLFIGLLAGGEGPRLTKHLNDFMFISHFHDPEDGFPNTDEIYGDGDENSISSVVKRSPTRGSDDLSQPRITAQEIEHLAELADRVTVSVEVKQYQLNIVSFLRLHRAVGWGISAVATQHLEKLSKCLAPLHGLNYATPSLVALAARKIYLHRIHIVKPKNERSMQWGSDVTAVAAILEGVAPEDVIEDVLVGSGIETPL
ncbi:hypothetical protein BP6252_00720 [Coleophoma cylindrospora]|uniref:magnesium chelatase n=1 Tax=Coleophoma cylindrospora TaxID=1849047 RepID=A0A3D8SSF0_9HELO|nr:hypothetical protein BP6252_00720 [Coleophoma cylindrospora]